MAAEPAVPPHAISPGAILGLIRSGEARTRGELIAATGLSRSTMLQRLAALQTARLVVSRPGDRRRNGGRPPTALRFNEDAGVVLAADLGVAHARLAVCNLNAEPLAEAQEQIDMTEEPETVLEWLTRELRDLLKSSGRTSGDMLAVGVGVPAHVDFPTGRLISPPIMPSWDGFPLAEALGERLRATVLVDNDVNIMALGEHHTQMPEVAHMAFVKVATGIGAGVIADGRVYRGVNGAAGDIGHIRYSLPTDVPCTCGNTGCVAALASGAAVVRRLAADGYDVASSEDVVELVRRADPHAVRCVRDAGRVLGEALANLVTVLAPAAIVLGGELAEAGEPLLAGIRETIHERALPLATRDLRITTSRLGPRAGIVGAATMAADHALMPTSVDALVTARAGG